MNSPASRPPTPTPTAAAAADQDPDRAILTRAVRSIAVQVAIVCAVMVLIGASLFLFYVWWKSLGPDRDGDGPRGEARPHHLLVMLDPVDLAVAGVILGVVAIALAGVAAAWIARRASEPLAESLRRQRSFVADASHELRTPLTVLSARVQQLAAMTRGDQRLSPVVTELREDTRILTEIVEDLLHSSAGEDPDAPPARLERVMESVGADLRVLAEGRDVHLEVSPVSAEVMPSEGALRRCLTALVDNAIGHTPAGGRVRIQARVVGRWAEVRVSDEGTGIRGIEPERVFERFAHGAASEAEPTRSSHGIGLALVHDVVTRRGGSAAVERTGPEGTTFLLRLPRVHDRGGRR